MADLRVVGGESVRVLIEERARVVEAPSRLWPPFSVAMKEAAPLQHREGVGRRSPGQAGRALDRVDHRHDSGHDRLGHRWRRAASPR